MNYYKYKIKRAIFLLSLSFYHIMKKNALQARILPKKKRHITIQ